ncbi:hypothetical protein TRAPUB_6001 [Trametes pubescens]|uniref:Uncharacterized protein n=1 Tax=Trametes pubescens TaxID=154538 RepID=A0A1M2V786_TRAPU|nr:hypothetical protein TRAPUB_6001 [Trametes pubescens]
MPEGYIANKHDTLRAQRKDLKRYLKPLQAGEMCVKARGKEFVIAAGYHALRVHFALEGTMVVLPTRDFMDMISEDCPGNNGTASKAARMHSFIVPSRLRDPNARELSHSNQTLAIFAAVVGAEYTLAMVDHNRLLRIHIMSRSVHWRTSDLEPGSEMWSSLWSDNHGPDWIHEREAACAALDAWRLSILAEPAKGRQPAMVDIMCSTQEVFAGFGQHTAHDALHDMAMHPGTPPIFICSDDDRFARLKSTLGTYPLQYVSNNYRQRCLSYANQPSPIAYNYTTDDNFLQRYLKVYRKSVVRMSRELYNEFARLGLFNRLHRIGEPYSVQPEELINVAYTEVPVYQFAGATGDPVYSAIVASRPYGWQYTDDVVDEMIAPDARGAGFSTTLGPASFQVFKDNQHEFDTQGKPGRKAKVRTGKRGRPAKAEPLVGKLRERAARAVSAQARAHARAEVLSSLLQGVEDHEVGGRSQRVGRAILRAQSMRTDRKTRSHSTVV